MYQRGSSTFLRLNKLGPHPIFFVFSIRFAFTKLCSRTVTVNLSDLADQFNP